MFVVSKFDLTKRPVKKKKMSVYDITRNNSPVDGLSVNINISFHPSENDTVYSTTEEKSSTFLDQATIDSLEDFRIAFGSIHGYISVVVCVFGIIANTANIVVLTRKNMIISITNLILLWLAVMDILKMLDYVPFAMRWYIFVEENHPPGSHGTRSYAWMCFLLFHASFSIFCHTIAIWLTIALAIFRFLYIWFPTNVHKWCSRYRAKLVILVVFICVFIALIPNFIMNSYKYAYENRTIDNETYRDYQYVYDMRNGIIHDVNFYIQAVLIKLVPCAALTILTFLLIYAMHKAYKKRMALKSEGREEDADRHHEHNRTTGMLLAVVVLFLITELPQGMLTLLMIFIKELQQEFYNKIGDVLDILALCNNAINFVLYCSMSKQFRDTFVRIFCRCCPKNRPGWIKIKLITAKRNGNRNYKSTGTVTHVWSSFWVYLCWKLNV